MRYTSGLQQHEKDLIRKHGANIIAGIDEVGRGALAGPIVAVCCSFDVRAKFPKNIKDSKLLTFKERIALAPTILDACKAWSASIVEADAINQKGIGWANKEIFRQSLAEHPQKIDLALYDGRPMDLPHVHAISVIDGDARCTTIAAASIVAKVLRDLIMISLHETHPQFHFDQHKGYGTSQHMEAIIRYGTLAHIHRKDFIHIQQALL